MKNLILIFLLTIQVLFAQSIVINKFFNSGQPSGQNDAVELLVIEKDLNLQGMILKDFSSSMNNDNGGKYLFTTNPIWSKLPSGCLVVIRVSDQSTDVDTSDFVLDVGLKDTSLFVHMGTGTFDIATTELLMIKNAGSDTAGVVGSIHAFGAGTAGTFFNLAPEPKLRSSRTAASGKFVYAKNSNSLLADFNGTDADTSSSLVLGQPNNETNALFINRLRTGETKVESKSTLIENFELFNNFPNPFNPSTNISFKLNKESKVQLEVFNIIGKKIETILNDRLKPGYYEFKFIADDLPGGVYFYRLKTEFGTASKKMILVK